MQSWKVIRPRYGGEQTDGTVSILYVTDIYSDMELYTGFSGYDSHGDFLEQFHEAACCDVLREGFDLLSFAITTAIGCRVPIAESRCDERIRSIVFDLQPRIVVACSKAVEQYVPKLGTIIRIRDLMAYVKLDEADSEAAWCQDVLTLRTAISKIWEIDIVESNRSRATIAEF